MGIVDTLFRVHKRTLIFQLVGSCVFVPWYYARVNVSLNIHLGQVTIVEFCTHSDHAVTVSSHVWTPLASPNRAIVHLIQLHHTIIQENLLICIPLIRILRLPLNMPSVPQLFLVQFQLLLEAVIDDDVGLVPCAFCLSICLCSTPFDFSNLPVHPYRLFSIQIKSN